jgi:hypothetical protein
MAYVSTFERDPWVQEQYQKYLQNFNNAQKKREDRIDPPKNPPILKKANNTNSCR